jgi:hypothetical protein
MKNKDKTFMMTNTYEFHMEKTSYDVITSFKKI